jgi:hypothetical protein
VRVEAAVLLLVCVLLLVGGVLLFGVLAGLLERQQLAGVIGDRELGDVDLVDRDPGLEVGAVVDQQQGVLDRRPVLGAELEVVGACRVRDHLLDRGVVARHLLGDVGPDPGAGGDRGA